MQCGSSGKFCCDVAYYDPTAHTIFSTVPSIYSFCYDLTQGLHWSLTTFIPSPLLHKTLSIGDNVGEKIWRSEKGKERNRQRIDRPAWESTSEQRDEMLLLKYKSRVWHRQRSKNDQQEQQTSSSGSGGSCWTSNADSTA